MTSTLKPVEAVILAGIKRDLARLLAVDLVRDRPPDRMEAGRLRLAVQDAHKGIVAVRAAEWLGRGDLGPAERKQVSRALEALERVGIVERLAFGYDGLKTTHVRLVRE